MREFSNRALTWAEREEQWAGTVPQEALGELLQAAISRGVTNFSVEDPPLKDVVALIYEEGRSSDAVSG